MPKISEQAPIPNAAESTATAAKPGCRRRVRTAIDAVLPEVAQPARDPGSARFFLLQRGVAKLALSGASGILFRHAVLHQFLDLHLQVDFHLFPQEAGAFAVCSQ